MRFSTAAFVLCLSSFVGCSQQTSPPVLPAQRMTSQAAWPLSPAGEAAMAHGFKPLYSFKGNPDGQNPYAGLTVLKGTLYGTTELGGKSDFGVAYKVSASGTERVLHSFAGQSDGGDPYGNLIALDGALYGTTYYGRPRGAGTGYGAAYTLSPSGHLDVVCGFKGKPDAEFPYAGVVADKGALYGTTRQGGKHGYGAVYKCTMSGTEHVLHSFANAPDGAFPYAPLTVLGGALYGTTYQGGTTDSDYGYGTVYKVTPSGKERVLHKFTGYPNDGQYPYAGLLALNGTLYGTTFGGGAQGAGTVYKISPSGKESVLYSFKGSPDGRGPYAGLIAVNGALYGTTSSGGAHYQGTVYKVTTSGAEQVLYSFTNVAPDGSDPIGSLVNFNGTLYGTAFYGGKNGNGIVFKIKP